MLREVARIGRHRPHEVRLRPALAFIEVGREPVQQDIAAPAVLNRTPYIEERLAAIPLALVENRDMVPPWHAKQFSNKLLEIWNPSIALIEIQAIP